MGIKVRIEEKTDESAALTDKPAARRERLRRETEEGREKEIESSLSEIYRDREGKKIDVNRMKIRRRQGLIFWFFNLLIFCLVAIVLGLGAYYYIILGKGTDSTAVDLSVSSPESVSAGEEFVYTIKYKNSEYIALKNTSLRADYPENFIFLDAEPRADKENNFWDIGRINPRSSGEIKIRGKIIDQAKTSGILLVQMVYTPENFSSEFKKENSASVLVRDTGFKASLDYSEAALVGEEESLIFNFQPAAKNYLPEFIIRLEKGDNIELGKTTVNRGAAGEKNGFSLKAEKINDDKKNAWLLSGLGDKEETFEIKYRVKEKKSDQEEIKVFFEEEVGGKSFVFFASSLPLEVMKSDLNLNLILNGSRDNQPADFGQKLNFSVAYANKGEAAMKEVVVMAVLKSDFLDWTTLDDKNKGQERGDTITWTKDEIPALEKVGVNESGTIDFSINVLPFKESDLGKDFKIISYAQYVIGGIEKFGEESATTTATSTQISGSDNKSNTIENTINSDLSFKEQVRYFDENNLPVGNGPLPPAVGERTSFKVYWDLTNNLHDLNDVRMETVLPSGVDWDGRNRTSVGTISYDEASKKVTWQIGRLPITVFKANAEFSIGFTPREEDRNKIVVLLSGSSVTAVDLKTGSALNKVSVPKTTKLEDDDIAAMSSDGRVK
jgi:hypothetical protein